ncbi:MULTISPECIES: hypothetical protein [Hydrocarboniphaga]|jgi:hypothetical protein|uniref:Uncharacterized protein n=1 Tax=Hydrocarboniphaga effusa AP103 TaxID=1172194 RepID=I8TCM1_9GAMM|nr:MULTISPECIES: hypothetical protein [Hydrocarboniphaga]EIT71418.1 hypothetical protein WQQ_15550 [Hydrocarboniphaga effusa AP103]MDZ4079349.1 hypothetical protein [Hydrocarboniphaga sp.]
MVVDRSTGHGTAVAGGFPWLHAAALLKLRQLHQDAYHPADVICGCMPQLL